MSGKRTEIYSVYLTLLSAFEIFLLRNRMREEVPSSVTGFLHAVEQRFCPLCYASVTWGSSVPDFIVLRFLDRV